MRLGLIFVLVCLSSSLMAQDYSFDFEKVRFTIDLSNNTEKINYENKETGELRELTREGDKARVVMSSYETASYNEARDLRYIPGQRIKGYFISLVNDSRGESYLIYYGPQTKDGPIEIKVDNFQIHKDFDQRSFQEIAQTNKVLEFTANDISKGVNSSVKVLGLIYPTSSGSRLILVMPNLEVKSIATPIAQGQPFIPEAIHLKGEKLTLIKEGEKVEAQTKTLRHIEVLGPNNTSTGLGVKSCRSYLRQ